MDYLNREAHLMLWNPAQTPENALVGEAGLFVHERTVFVSLLARIRSETATTGLRRRLSGGLGV
jgi:hypothetical protein